MNDNFSSVYYFLFYGCKARSDTPKDLFDIVEVIKKHIYIISIAVNAFPFSYGHCQALTI
jgi:hypothetical protein